MAPAVVALGVLGACVGDSFETGGGGAGSGGGSQGGSTSSGSGGEAPTDGAIGCADGEREGYKTIADEPDIAACAGGFTVPGVSTTDSRKTTCGRRGGDDGPKPSGDGCSVEDLCSDGWHVCDSAEDVDRSAKSHACPEDVSGDLFWATRQGQDSTGECIEGGTNNLVGCSSGALGQSAPDSCEPLERAMRYNHCADPLVLWSCGESGQQEGQVVTKPSPDQGGVLCCRD